MLLSKTASIYKIKGKGFLNTFVLSRKNKENIEFTRLEKNKNVFLISYEWLSPLFIQGKLVKNERNESHILFFEDSNYLCVIGYNEEYVVSTITKRLEIELSKIQMFEIGLKHLLNNQNKQLAMHSVKFDKYPNADLSDEDKEYLSFSVAEIIENNLLSKENTMAPVSLFSTLHTQQTDIPFMWEKEDDRVSFFDTMDNDDMFLGLEELVKYLSE